MYWFFWDAMIFCNNFARWLQKIVATCDVMMYWFFWDAMIFCNNFARWIQKIVATCDVSAVGNSPPFWRNLPFHEFPQQFNHNSYENCKRFKGNVQHPRIWVLTHANLSSLRGSWNCAVRVRYHPLYNNFMLPKRRYWMAERTFGNAFSK